jgi:hypothetical protein
MGHGVNAPSLDPKARVSGWSTAEQEPDTKEIAALRTKAVAVAAPYFEWFAEQAVLGTQLNVLNKGSSLLERYEYFRDCLRVLSAEAETRKDERHITKEKLGDGTDVTSGWFPDYALRREADWNAQAAVEAFFS